MSGDYSRFTFDPVKRYSGVLMQQGRVQLDSDWNEEVDILRRRIRTLSLDAMGPVGVPYLSLPDSFLIGLVAGPPSDLSIEPGRLYVDGLVAEVFEQEGATYLNQPFYPDPPPLPNGDSVVYLDVWDREVTYIEDPELLDVALGGADTTARRQTVWQLRVEPRENAECGMPVGEEPSAGRLTTEAVTPPAPDDPCLLPPESGYRGLENRLYRVEVHEGGPLGAATFKWSRDNASIVSAVTAIAVAGGNTTLTVNRIGRDEVMRFRIGDWVEVTDDHRELMGEPGDMALIVDLDEANRQIVVDRALPAPGHRAFGANAAELAERHTRIKRWDQTASTNAIDGDGLISVTAGPIDIEEGIRVSFSTATAGGSFRVGDYWTFWARTATASIETLNSAPPRGVIHHYVQLAAITDLGGANEHVRDCRPPKPSGEGCCTVVVHPGESIQEAIDALPPEGGCVCLKAGIHEVNATIEIARSRVTLEGECPGAIVRSNQAAPALRIGTNAANIRVSTIQFEALDAEQAPQAVIHIIGSYDVALEDCGIVTMAPQKFVGVRIVRSDDVCIERCLIKRVQMGIWAEDYCHELSILRNEISLAWIQLPDVPTHIEEGSGTACILVQNSPSACRVEDNILSGALFGVVLNDNALVGGIPQSLSTGSLVSGNFISGAKTFPNSDDRTVLIDVASDLTTVKNNHLVYFFQSNTGIKVTGSECLVSENILLSQSQEVEEEGPIAIQVGHQEEGQEVQVIRCAVQGNVIYGYQHGVVALGVEDIQIAGNFISADSFSQAFAILLNSVRNGSIRENQIRFMHGVTSTEGRLNRITGNVLTDAASGVSLRNEWEFTVSENSMDRPAMWGAVASLVMGRGVFIENRINGAGYQNPIAMGIASLFHMGELHVESNEIMDTGNAVDGKGASRSYGIFGELILEARIESNLVTCTDLSTRDPEREDRALRMRGFYELSVTDDFTIGWPIQIISNKFVGTGRTALVELLQFALNLGSMTLRVRFERVNFDHNYCMHLASPEMKEAATVLLTGRRGIVMGNHIKATNRAIASVDFMGMPGPFIGNVTTSGARNHADFPVPEADFNMLG